MHPVVHGDHLGDERPAVACAPQKRRELVGHRADHGPVVVDRCDHRPSIVLSPKKLKDGAPPVLRHADRLFERRREPQGPAVLLRRLTTTAAATSIIATTAAASTHGPLPAARLPVGSTYAVKFRAAPAIRAWVQMHRSSVDAGTWP